MRREKSAGGIKRSYLYKALELLAITYLSDRPSQSQTPEISVFYYVDDRLVRIRIKSLTFLASRAHSGMTREKMACTTDFR